MSDFGDGYAGGNDSRPSLVPRRKPVPSQSMDSVGAGPARPAVSSANRPSLALSTDTDTLRMPQLLGDYTVSPTSSYHRDDESPDRDAQWDKSPIYGGANPTSLTSREAAKVLTPTGAQTYWENDNSGNSRHEALASSPLREDIGWPLQQQLTPQRSFHSLKRQPQPQKGQGQGQGQLESDDTIQHDLSTPIVPPQKRPLSPETALRSNPYVDNTPTVMPDQWQGSREQQELAKARAREVSGGRGPVQTSYGPAPVTTATRHQDKILPDLPATRPQWQGQNSSDSSRKHGQGTRETGEGPFMHYEDVAYFGPVNDPGPASPIKSPIKDSQSQPAPREVQQQRADSFPASSSSSAKPGIPIMSQTRHAWEQRLKPTLNLNPKRTKKRQKREEKMPATSVALPVPDQGLDAYVHAGPGSVVVDPEQQQSTRSGGLVSMCQFFVMISWLPELLWSLLSILCLAGVVLSLRLYDGRSLADWPLAVSLNTLVAFLATLCRALLAIPVTEGLAQLKWNWFARGRKRSVADFDFFESAAHRSSPLLGSARLLADVRKGRALGTTAAVIMLVGLVSSPLAQAAITYPTRLLPDGNGGSEVYVRVVWGWVTVLAVQVALGVLFLVGVMVQTLVWNVPVIKGGSVMPTLLSSIASSSSSPDRGNRQHHTVVSNNADLDGRSTGYISLCIMDEEDLAKLSTPRKRRRKMKRSDMTVELISKSGKGWVLELKHGSPGEGVP
ncbi:hypothetical protein QBC46DRAFT_433768 [Diplogelasinospora grovesii]|uniref:Uncharacterized protein n=1 Tax=Diplogelasinospora grovesii TaxID=303347 RepID=A0AAN6S9H3_9PEZI|nr:hypothetical protein QBC46DRAFT_433768 [Diplogelasinospora grovesii]